HSSAAPATYPLSLHDALPICLLVSSQQSVGEIERQLRMSQPTVSKHLRVLRDAGFVESTVDAQRRLYRLKPEPFREVDTWLAQRSEEHTSELQSRGHLVCRLL